ncbi:DCC1-like thiol-disulfide oxidoreductase family protein [Bosea sp. BK604]|uniref:DCC1-like thiol-disulfide oxidoreductase family protein n=1 Tax=Bosea sp. BK604 TaxID=2512180 RepID=UPI0010EA5959|nr:2-polyprenyl-6-methoxyphenol hydroxylase-like FAD-dependent oxidoreductase [Bosea sp. BK604]
MPTRTIAIAGCGPAGLAAALLLHRDGHRVTIYERFETPQPVGSGLMIQPTGLAVLHELGLDAEILAAGARIDRLFGCSVPSERIVLDVRYAALGNGAGHGIGIHRAALFGALYNAASAARIPILTGRGVTSAELAPDGRRVLSFADGGQAGPFDLVVDALGTSSPLAAPTGRALSYGAFWASLDWVDGAGFDPAALEQRYLRASRMVGVLPIGRPSPEERPKATFFWSLRADALDAWRQAGLATWKAEVLKLWPATAPFLDQVRTPEQLTFARYSQRTLARPAEPGLIHLGDSWHSTSPQLGQGANMALLDAHALAKALRENDDPALALGKAVALRRGHVRLYQGMSALFTPVYQSDSRALPFLRDRIAGPLSRIPPGPWVLAAMVSGLIGWPLRSLGLSVRAPADFGPELAARTRGRPLIVFDGDCVMCSVQAQFVLRHDHARRFNLTTAQGVIGQELYRRLGLPTEDFQTMLLVENGRVLSHSDAVIGIATGLGWPWRAARIAKLVPRALRDRLYRLVARNRYRWFGKRETCWRPTPDVADRIL